MMKAPAAKEPKKAPIHVPMSEEQIAKDEQMMNSLTSLCEQFNFTAANMLSPGYGPEISQADGLFENMRWYLISNLRQLLSQAYVEHGIVQTMVDQPVDDAFRAGFEIKTSQLDGNELEKLLIYCKRNNVIRSVMQASKWSRLYGGGAVIIITNQNPETPLRMDLINEKTPIEFRSVDMWELFYDVQNTTGNLGVGQGIGDNLGDFYNYYGKRIHHTRVHRVIGKEAPSFIKPRLRGWGMSELERLVRSLNQYLKNQDVIFELLNEAKIDVYKIKNYNSALMTEGGTGLIANRIQRANQIKNYQNAITMDAADDYMQKQINFTGLGEMLLQIRQGIAADLKMPMTKIWGISAAGFNSGEDDIENYNSMVEGEVRQKVEFTMVDVLMVACQKIFGMTPDDLQINWNPLRVLNAKDEEEVKDSQFNRVMAAYQSGLVPDIESKKAINKDSLLGIEIDENTPADDPINGGMDADVKSASGKSGGGAPDKGKAK
jgi:hypothetical protein